MTSPSGPPAIEKQDTGLLLQAARDAVLAAKKDSTDLKELLERVGDLKAQNEKYEQEIDGARSRIFSLLCEQLRNREASHADEYVNLIDESIKLLLGEEKKEKP